MYTPEALQHNRGRQVKKESQTFGMNSEFCKISNVVATVDVKWYCAVFRLLLVLLLVLLRVHQSASIKQTYDLW